MSNLGVSDCCGAMIAYAETYEPVPLGQRILDFFHSLFSKDKKFKPKGTTRSTRCMRCFYECTIALPPNLHGWDHACCQSCWYLRQLRKGTIRDPITLDEADPEPCCFCGKTTSMGIYVREDPKSPDVICTAGEAVV